MAEVKKSDSWNLWGDKFKHWRSLYETEFPVMVYFNFDNINEGSSQENRYVRCQWFPSDDLSRYQKSGNKKYLPEDFSYHLNQNLFRCDNFEKIVASDNPRLLVYGCSNTFGIGLPEEETWPVILKTMLEEKHNKPFELINLGIPGGSADDVKLVSLWQDKFNPNYVCALMPPHHRGTAAVGRKIEHYTPANPIREPKQLYDIYDQFAATLTEHFTFNSHVATEQLKTLSRMQNAKTYILDVHDVVMETPLKFTKPEYKARDGQHYGAVWHHDLAEQFFKGLFNE